MTNPRFLSWVDDRPELNKPIRYRKDTIVVTGYGKSWYMSEEDADTGVLPIGNGDGYCCYCYYRMATPEEATELTRYEEQRLAERTAAKRRHDRILEIASTIDTDGTYPPPTTGLIPVGDTYLDTRTIYGGGDWFVIDATGAGPQGEPAIWHIRNNGGDGDNWAYNNVRTGGAGGIGNWIPYDPELAAELISLELPKETI